MRRGQIGWAKHGTRPGEERNFAEASLVEPQFTHNQQMIAPWKFVQ